jgi:hypothetical protein
MTAAEHVTRTADALDAALTARNRLLRQWDQIADPGLGLPLGEGLGPDATLADYSRAADRARRER